MRCCSPDDKVREAGISTRAGRRWAPDVSVAQAESMLISNPCMGCQGLGSTHFQQRAKADPKQRRDMVHAQVQKLEEEGMKSKAAVLGSQGTWVKCDLPKWKITWPELWRLEPFRVSSCSVQSMSPFHQISTGGERGRTHSAGYVGRERWHTSWQDAR